MSDTKCLKCRSPIPHSYEKCPTCGRPFDRPPNVREVESAEEVEALDARYSEAWERAKAGGYHAQLAELEEELKKSCAVINVGLDFLYSFVVNSKAQYAAYARAVVGGARKPAARDDDAARRSTEALLFPGYADRIVYAALSLDGSGPRSYGEFALRLRGIAIEDRATLLEENSFDFVVRRSIGPRDSLPLGFRARWQDRHKLAVAKLASRLSSGATAKEFSTMLLRSEGRRETDDFIEVHIYDTFDIYAVESVRGVSSVKSKSDRALLAMVKARLKDLGIMWVEE